MNRSPHVSYIHSFRYLKFTVVSAKILRRLDTEGGAVHGSGAVHELSVLHGVPKFVNSATFPLYISCTHAFTFLKNPHPTLSSYIIQHHGFPTAHSRPH
jgi:hypothetical protein